MVVQRTYIRVLAKRGAVCRSDGAAGIESAHDSGRVIAGCEASELLDPYESGGSDHLPGQTKHCGIVNANVVAPAADA